MQRPVHVPSLWGYGNEQGPARRDSVVVTDDGKGALEVTELTYDGKTELPVFTNTYVKPMEPPKDDSGLMQTGDSTSTFVGVIAGLGALSVAVGLAAHKRHGE